MNHSIVSSYAQDYVICRNHFRDYAELCFKEFGDKIKYWITFNEPWTFSKNAYARGLLAPARCSNWQKLNCTGGDSATEPYLVTHHQLLAHAKVVKLYKDKYQVLFEKYQVIPTNSIILIFFSKFAF